MDSLINRFPTSEALFAWLRSDEGGRLIVREDWMVPSVPLVLIHYDKTTSDLTLPHVGQFRSVIWDAITNRPVCCAPARIHSFNQAIDDGIKPSDGVVDDFVDGVMINLFHAYGEWRVSTHTVPDGDCSFYGHRSFADLFWETFYAKGLTVEMLTPAVTYSFVLQHPDERIVVAPPYGSPTLFLVDVSQCNPNDLVALDPALAALRPTRHTGLATLEDVKERVANWGKRFGAGWKGVVIRIGDRRYKLESEPYLEAQALRGNEPNRRYLWLSLWSQGRLGAYLRLYPEEQNDANEVIQAFKDLTKEAHQIYTDIYRNRAYPLGQAPQKFRKLLWEAHVAKKAAYFPHFREFMNGLDTARKLWLVNWERRFAGRAQQPPQPQHPDAVPPQTETHTTEGGHGLSP